MKEIIVSKSTTKTIDISDEPQRVFEFLSNPLNWPQFAIVNLKSIKAEKNGWFGIVSKNGEGKLKLMPNKEYGILDHIWEDSQATWKVFMRVIPNGDGCIINCHFFSTSTSG